MPFKNSPAHLPDGKLGACLPPYPFARALPARQIVNINDYNPHDWIASFKQAFSEGQTVVVPAGFVCENINTGIFIPPAKRCTSLEACAATAEGVLSYKTAAGDRGEGRPYA